MDKIARFLVESDDGLHKESCGLVGPFHHWIGGFIGTPYEIEALKLAKEQEVINKKRTHLYREDLSSDLDEEETVLQRKLDDLRRKRNDRYEKKRKTDHALSDAVRKQENGIQDRLQALRLKVLDYRIKMSKSKKKEGSALRPGVPLRLREKLGPRWRKRIGSCPFEPKKGKMTKKGVLSPLLKATIVGGAAGAPIGGILAHRAAKSGAKVKETERSISKREARGKKATRWQEAKLQAARESQHEPGTMTVAGILAGLAAGALSARSLMRMVTRLKRLPGGRKSLIKSQMGQVEKLLAKVRGMKKSSAIAHAPVMRQPAYKPAMRIRKPIRAIGLKGRGGESEPKEK